MMMMRRARTAKRERARAMAGAPSGGAVLVVDGVDVPASSSAAVPATAAAWLEAWAPRGVYTATRTTGHHARLSRWDEHAKRLRGMLSALREHDPASFASAPALPATDEAMRALVAPTVERALARRRAMTAKGESSSPSSSSSSSPPPPRESMVVVAVSPTARGAWRVGAHACAFDAAAKLPPATCVVVPHSKRAWPSVKDTAWPSLRRALVQRTSQTFETSSPSPTEIEPLDEILLSDADGDALTEGGVTNFFVVVEETKRGGRGDSSAAGARTSDVFVQTAPVSECLAGVGRAAAFAACAAIGVRVVEKTPRLSENSAEAGSVWKEAFLTNAVRGVRGVRAIRSSAIPISGNEDDAKTKTRAVTFDPGPGPDADAVTTRLEAHFAATRDV